MSATKKEAHTGIPGKPCLYSGDAASGLQIQLAPNDTLTVSLEQLQAIVKAVGARNQLLETCVGMRERPTPAQIAAEWLAKRMRRKNRSARGNVDEKCAQQVSPRLADWLNGDGAKAFGRALTDEQALCVQGVLASERLPPVADAVSAVKAMVGRRVIYEENRRFIAAELQGASVGGANDYLTMTLSNLSLPGFSSEFPPAFTAGGEAGTLSMSPGILSGYSGMWMLITCPAAVERIIGFAATCSSRRDLLEECRAVMHGRHESPY
jgi:hypothetical protein